MSLESSDIKFSCNYEEGKLKRLQSEKEGVESFSYELIEEYLQKKKDFQEHT